QLGAGNSVKTMESSNRTAAKGPDRAQVEAARGMSQSDRSAMIKQMVTSLAERLRSDGGSIDEWMRLVRSYTVLGDKDGATTAIADARKAMASNKQAIASLDELARKLGL
ncbi:unnamed protein product, partial [marine sediment metagenome]